MEQATPPTFSTPTRKALKTALECILKPLAGKTAIKDDIVLEERFERDSKLLTLQYLQEKIKELGLEAKLNEYTNDTSDDSVPKDVAVNGCNLFTILPASAPSVDFIVIGAHYDSVWNGIGAVDNASGTAACLVVLQELCTAKLQTKANLIVSFFDQEETGILGSKHFANFIQEQERMQGWKIRSVHTLDMVAYIFKRRWELGLKGAGTYIANMYKEALQHCEHPVLDLRVERPRRSDYLNFQGVGQGWGRGPERMVSYPHWHRKTDTYEKINFEYAAATVQLLFVTLATALLKEKEDIPFEKIPNTSIISADHHELAVTEDTKNKQTRME